jgi:hypothetical protein
MVDIRATTVAASLTPDMPIEEVEDSTVDTRQTFLTRRRSHVYTCCASLFAHDGTCLRVRIRLVAGEVASVVVVVPDIHFLIPLHAKISLP